MCENEPCTSRLSKVIILQPGACILFMHGHFWSSDKDGGHTIPSVKSQNSMLHANFVALCFVELELLPMKVSSFTLE